MTISPAELRDDRMPSTLGRSHQAKGRVASQQGHIDVFQEIAAFEGFQIAPAGLERRMASPELLGTRVGPRRGGAEEATDLRRRT